ncbi:MAG: hypothetical protein V4671_07700 [Armatimonadota bacterium]
MSPEPTPGTVQTQDVAQQIRQLRQMRREATWWRLGSLAVIALTVVYSIATLRSSALALVQPGPGQTEFTNKLTAGLQQDVFPNVQQIATQTLTEMRPEVMTAFEKLNERTPEVAQASLEQMELLQQNLPARSEKILDETFSAEMKKREGTIKEMFPDVTEEKMQTLVTNLTQAGQKRMPQIADRLIGKHVSAVHGIVGNITTIHDQEKVNAGSEAATWEMTLAVVDLVRDDLREMAPPEAKTGGAKPVAAAASTKSGEAKK